MSDFANNMHELIARRFNKNEKGLADELAGYIIEYASFQPIGNISAYDYFMTEGDNLFEKAADMDYENLFRFLYKYATDDLYEAIDWELYDDDKEDAIKSFDNILSRCLSLAPEIDVDEWKETFNEWLSDNYKRE